MENSFFKAQGCVCKHIGSKSFNISHLVHNSLTCQEQKELTICRMEADNGNVGAVLSYAYFLRNNQFLQQAYELFKRAAQLGSCEALSELSSYYIKENKEVGGQSLIIVEDITIVDWLAEAGYNNMCRSGEFLYSLGLCYEEYLERPEEAFKSYQKSAQLGFLGGISMLGDCYLNGVGTKKDLEKAYFWYKKGSKLGCPVSCDELGMRDLSSAYEWFAKEAELDGGYYNGIEKLVDKLNELLPRDSERVYLEYR